MLYKEIKTLNIFICHLYSIEMASIEDHKCFLQLLVYGNNHKQNLVALKQINEEQYKCSKNIANDILEEIIPLNSQEFKILIHYKNFIRKLGRDTVSKTLLAKNLSVIIELAKIVLKDYEECKKTSISTYSVIVTITGNA